MRRMMMLCCPLLLAACAPEPDLAYCRSFGVENTPEFSKCMTYYHSQQAAFSADRAVCDAQADETYPPSLYDYGGYAHTVGGFGFGGRYYGGQTIRIDPDYHKNAELDRLRQRIIEPCMQARGWVSGSSWQAGRQAPSKSRASSKPASAGSLPWLK